MTAPIVANVILQQTEPRFILFFNDNEGWKCIVARKKRQESPHIQRGKENKQTDLTQR